MRSTFLTAATHLTLTLVVAFLSLAATPATAQETRTARPTFYREAWGLGFTVPPAWRTADKDDLLLVVSDTEAGLMIVRFLPRASREELLAGYRQGIQEAGFVARPVAEAQPFELPGATGFAGLLEGQAQDGTTIRVRSVGVLSRFGGAAVVVGLTTPPQFAQLQARVDALARSLVFSAPPKAAPIAGDYQFFTISQGGGYSREARLTLCTSGRYTTGGELSSSGSAGSRQRRHLVSHRGRDGWNAPAAVGRRRHAQPALPGQHEPARPQRLRGGAVLRQRPLPEDRRRALLINKARAQGTLPTMFGARRKSKSTPWSAWVTACRNSLR
jgi:hypothetical protein